MYKIECAEIWGGNKAGDATLTSPGLTATLYSSSGDGIKGGDIYYLTLCNSTYITRVAIADVTGHGEAVSDISHSLYRSLSRHVDDLHGEEVLVELNKDAIKKGVDAITTAVVATYYREDKTFSYVYAGHPPMLLNRSNASGWDEMNSDEGSGAVLVNIPLAIDTDAIYTQETVQLDCGDRILLYTDGLLETKSPDGEPFGMSRLKQTLTSRKKTGLEELRNLVIDELCRHAGGRLEHDDVSLLILEIK